MGLILKIRDTLTEAANTDLINHTPETNSPGGVYIAKSANITTTEDFLTYVFLSYDNEITRTATALTYTQLLTWNTNQWTHCGKDKGVDWAKGYVKAEYTYTQNSGTTGAKSAFLAFSNNSLTLEVYVRVWRNNAGKYKIGIFGTTATTNPEYELDETTNNIVYLTFTRDDLSSNYILDIYSDSGRTTLVASITSAISGGINSWRKVWMYYGGLVSSSLAFNGSVKDLVLERDTAAGSRIDVSGGNGYALTQTTDKKGYIKDTGITPVGGFVDFRYDLTLSAFTASAVDLLLRASSSTTTDTGYRVNITLPTTVTLYKDGVSVATGSSVASPVVMRVTVEGAVVTVFTGATDFTILTQSLQYTDPAPGSVSTQQYMGFYLYDQTTHLDLFTIEEITSGLGVGSITYVAGANTIEIIGSLDTGNPTATTTTTITDTTKTWTINANKDHIVFIRSGVGAGQTRNIISNTSSQLTVDFPWDTTPNNSSQYDIAYNYQEMIDSINDITKIDWEDLARKICVCTAHIINKGSGTFADIGIDFKFNGVDLAWQSEPTSITQFGVIKEDGKGVNGGSILMPVKTDTANLDKNMHGIFKMFGAYFNVQSNSLTNKVRYNYQDDPGVGTPVDGLEIRSSFLNNITLALHQDDRLVDNILFESSMELEQKPKEFNRNQSLQSVIVPKAPVAGELSGILGGNIYGINYSGGSFSLFGSTRPIYLDANFDLNKGVLFIWDSDFGYFETDAGFSEEPYHWVTGATGKIYRGITYAVTIVDGNSVGVANARVRVVDNGDNPRAITDKDVEANQFAPVYSTTIFTDATGKYIETNTEFGDNKGLHIVKEVVTIGTPPDSTVVSYVGPYKVIVRKYGFVPIELTTSWDFKRDVSATLIFATNEYLNSTGISEPTAQAYTGISIPLTVGIIVVSEAHTFAELYAYAQSIAVSQMQRVTVPMSTLDGVNFSSPYKFDIQAAVTPTGTQGFSNADLVSLNTGGSINGIDFSSPLGTHLLELNAGQTISNINFNTYASKHAIKITLAGTYNLTNVVFDASGTNDIETTHASGVVTINITGGSTPTITQTGAGTVTVVSNPISIKASAVKTDGTAIANARVLLKASDGTGPFPFEEVVTITRSGSTATVNHVAHNLDTNDYAALFDAGEAEYNGVKQVTVLDVDNYTFAVTGTPTTPATGTIKSTFVALYGLTDVNGDLSTSRVYTANQPVSGWTRKSTSSPFFKQGLLVGTIDNTSGFTGTAVMTSDE